MYRVRVRILYGQFAKHDDVLELRGADQGVPDSCCSAAASTSCAKHRSVTALLQAGCRGFASRLPLHLTFVFVLLTHTHHFLLFSAGLLKTLLAGRVFGSRSVTAAICRVAPGGMDHKLFSDGIEKNRGSHSKKLRLAFSRLL